MEVLSSITEYVNYVGSVLDLLAHPETIEKHLGYLPSRLSLNTRIGKKAIRERLKGKCSMYNAAYTSNGDIVCLLFLEHPKGTRRTAFTEGLVMAYGPKEIPFQNIVEQKTAMDSAIAMYHYMKEFQHYNCSAGK
jgi:hypothetical protein